MQSLPAASLLYLTLGICGCGEVTGLPSAEPVPVLQGLLIIGEPQHLLRASWSSPTHLPYESGGRPIDASLVDLWLVTPRGDSVRYAPSGVAGEFAVVATVSAGERYLLSGTVAARAVTAQVTVPGNLVVGQPADDTIRMPLGTDLLLIPFAWRAESAATYQALLVEGNGTTHRGFIRRDRGLLDIAPDTIGQLLISLSRAEPDTARLVIFGYDRTAAAFLSSTTKGNVHGAFGLFGAAAKAEKVVVWE